jgi:hypothetical protein
MNQIYSYIVYFFVIFLDFLWTIFRNERSSNENIIHKFLFCLVNGGYETWNFSILLKWNHNECDFLFFALLFLFFIFHLCFFKIWFIKSIDSLIILHTMKFKSKVQIRKKMSSSKFLDLSLSFNSGCRKFCFMICPIWKKNCFTTQIAKKQ